MNISTAIEMGVFGAVAVASFCVGMIVLFASWTLLLAIIEFLALVLSALFAPKPRRRTALK